MIPIKLDLTAQLVYYFTLPGARSLTFTTQKGQKVKFYSQI